MYEIFDNYDVDNLISFLMDKLFNIKNFNVREFITSENNSIEMLGQNYRLSEPSHDIIKAFTRVHEIIQALITGAETSRVGFDNDVPVGANAVLNQDFKDRKIDTKLIEIDGNTGGGALMSILEIANQFDKILEAHLKNSGASIARDKRASIKRGNALIKQLLHAFDEGIFNDLFENVPELEELPVPTNANDELLAEIAVSIRTQLRNFENLFSAAFNALTQTSKEDFIQKLRVKFNERLDDTSAIQNDEDKINVTDADLYWYICSCTAKNPNNFDAAYLEWVKKNSKLCPFDSQEDVVLQAARMLSLTKEEITP
jgi:hypothetical protein